jgi:hypothetical protein
VAGERRLGWGLAMQDGDLAGGPDGFQLQEIRGLENLRQALTLRVLTPMGNDPFNITYGLDISQAFTRAANLKMQKELIKLSLVRTLSSDPRVREIRDVLFEDDLDLRHQRTWTVKVVLDTIDDRTTALSVSLGV